MVLLSALSLTLLASLVSSSPTPSSLNPVVLPVRKSNAGISAQELVDHDIARLAHFNGHSSSNKTKRTASGPVTNEDVSYVAAVTICQQTFHLVVDTGSANTWVGANKHFTPCASSKSTGNAVSVSYGSGEFSGTEYTGHVSFAGLTASKQSFGVASASKGFTTVDGILGIGPVDLTENTVTNTNRVPTFPDNLHSEGVIKNEIIGVSFRPEHGSDTGDANGELTFGGTDPKKHSGAISYFPKTSVAPFSEYWGLSGIKFTYGRELVENKVSAIVDTGTTLILIPTVAFDAFAAESGGKPDKTSGLLSYKIKPKGNFVITIGGKEFALTPSQYLVPAAQYSHFGLSAGKYYSWIGDGGSDDVNCLIGQKFLENYYSVFDTTNKRIGFANP